MKTICRLANFKEPHVSIYLFTDDTPVQVLRDRTVVGDPLNPETVILDCNLTNCVLHEELDAPEGYCEWKHMYTVEDGWQIQPHWPDIAEAVTGQPYVAPPDTETSSEEVNPVKT